MPLSITDDLTPKQRRQEIAAILGRGLLRFRNANSNPCPYQIIHPKHSSPSKGSIIGGGGGRW